MTSNEIRIDAQLLTGLQIESVTAFTWIKDAIRFIVRKHPLAAPKKSVQFTSNGKYDQGDSYVFPEELIQLDKVTKKNRRRPIASPYFTCEQNEITFFHSGDFDITYRYMPDDPQTVDSDIPLPDRYAEPIKYYLAARIRARIYGQGDPDSQGYEQLFWTHLDEMDAATDLANRRYRRMPVRY